RETTERPEAIAGGTAKLVGTNSDTIFIAAAELLSDSTAYDAMAMAINPFGDGLAASRILKIVEDYFSN
ncbi:UDP-N-acetylglucosamine 2-epimerase, partial [Microcoleus sp. A2-C5]